MSKQYEIEKISDIFQIPADRFDDFLVDLKSYYETGHNMVDLIMGVGKAMETPVDVGVGKMTWIDDGRKDIHIKLNTEGAK